MSIPHVNLFLVCCFLLHYRIISNAFNACTAFRCGFKLVGYFPETSTPPEVAALSALPSTTHSWHVLLYLLASYTKCSQTRLALGHLGFMGGDLGPDGSYLVGSDSVDIGAKLHKWNTEWQSWRQHATLNSDSWRYPEWHSTDSLQKG